MKRIGFTLGSLSTPIPLLSFPMSLFLLFLSFAPAHASEGRVPKNAAFRQRNTTFS